MEGETADVGTADEVFSVKEAPILFSAPMVRAILAGKKTQTRRIVSPQPVRSLPHTVEIPGPIDMHHPMGWRWRDAFWADSVGGVETNLPYHSPYGQVGDCLWVKETWRTYKKLDAKSPTAMAKACREAGWSNPWAPIEYLADGHIDNSEGDEPWGKTRVSIHMPRWASRLTLEVTSVRVERLQSITTADITAEGIPAVDYSVNAPPYELEAEQRNEFAELWDSINGKRASWAANPFVWALTFRRVEAAKGASAA